MKKSGKLIGRICLAALAAGLTPYQLATDKETGGFQLKALLWSVKKTPEQERNNYSIELFPLFGGSADPIQEAGAPAEEASAEPAAEEPAAESAPAAAAGEAE